MKIGEKEGGEEGVDAVREDEYVQREGHPK